MKNLYRENKPLFFVSLIGVLFTLTGIYFGVNFALVRQVEMDNKKLKIQNDSLRAECFTKDIISGRYEFIIDEFMLIKQDSATIDSIMKNVE